MTIKKLIYIAKTKIREEINKNLIVDIVGKNFYESHKLSDYKVMNFENLLSILSEEDFYIDFKLASEIMHMFMKNLKDYKVPTQKG